MNDPPRGRVGGRVKERAVRWAAFLMACHTQEDIAEREGVSKMEVSRICNEMADLPKGYKPAADWIDANQLGRRNLNPDQASLLRGRRYNRAKKAQGGDHKSKGQNDTLVNQADILAKQHDRAAFGRPFYFVPSSAYILLTFYFLPFCDPREDGAWGGNRTRTASRTEGF